MILVEGTVPDFFNHVDHVEHVGLVGVFSWSCRVEVALRAMPFPELLQREVREDFGLAFCKSRRLKPPLQNTFAGTGHLFTQKRSNSRHRHRRWRLMPRREDRHFACFAFTQLATNN